ncbi:MAG: AMP-binding protein [Gemmatimonadaceae bacterium]|nr:AMP-binding protein [Gemmatimonadaceae bacterium]
MMLHGADATPPRFATLGAMLRHAAAHSAPSDGLVFVGLDESETAYSWREVRDRAARAAAALVRRGVKPGDRVALVLPTSIGFMDAFFGTLLAGAVPVPLYPPVRLGRLDEYLAATVRALRLVRARLLVTDGQVRPILGTVVEQAGCDAVRVEQLADAEPGIELDAEPGTLGLIQFSSGSTLDPRAVALTHAQLLAQCEALCRVMRDCPGNTGVGASWLPLYHDMGLIGCLLSAAYHPGRLVLIAPEHFLAKPALWLRAIARHRAFISPAPNFAYAVCANRVRDADIAGLDLSCWQLALNGAEPVLASTLDAFTARFGSFGFDGRALMPVYGLSEAALAVTFSPPGRGARASARGAMSVGMPLPGFTVRIAGEDGTELPDGVEGRVLCRGPSVMHGYFRDAHATSAALRDGWLDTGDLGFIENGELHISGRARDVIIIRGANHMPQQFEEALLDLHGLRPGCAVAVGELSSEEGSEGLLILAERARQPALTDAELEVAVSTRILERTGIRARRVLLLAPGTLPRTSSGKLRRAEAAMRMRAGTLSAPGGVNAWTLAPALIRSALSWLRIGRRETTERQQRDNRETTEGGER